MDSRLRGHDNRNWRGRLVHSLRVAVIGVGRLGQAHARVYAGLPGVTLVGVFDAHQDRAQEVARRNGTAAFSDLDTLYQRVEAASVVVPTTSHFDVGRQALEHGLHVLIEKPITTTLQDADTLIRLARTRGVVLQVGHIERFNPAVRAVEGMTLSPGFIEAHRLALFDPRGTDVSVVHDLMIHDIDLIRHLVRSEIVQVDAAGVAVISDQIDIANARLRFDNGCVANVTASRISLKKMRKMRLFQRDAYISLDFLEGQAEVYRLTDGDSSDPHPTHPPAVTIPYPLDMGDGRTRQILCERPAVPAAEPLALELAAFVRAARGEYEPPVTGEDGREALRVSLEIVGKIQETL